MPAPIMVTWAITVYYYTREI